MEVDVRKEEGIKDEKALMCYVPDVLPEKVANTKMESKSIGKSFIIRDVLGQGSGESSVLPEQPPDRLAWRRKGDRRETVSDSSK